MNELNFNIFNIIIISGVVQGIIFSLIVFTNKTVFTNSTIFLGLVVLFLSLSNLQYWLIDTHIINEYLILKYLFIPWQWLVLPMFYLYVHKFIGEKRNNATVKTILLIPFFLICSIYLSLIIYKFLFDLKYKFPSHFERGIFMYLEFLSILFNVIVMYFTYRMVDVHEKKTTYDIKWVKSETNWLKKLIYIGFAICFCWLIAITIITVFDLNKSYLFYPMWIGISVLIYWIGYVGLSKSQQLRNRIELRKKRILELENKEKLVTHKATAFDKIEHLIKDNKYYLNPDLSLGTLSKEINLSEGYISQLFSKNSNKNFNDYINQLRIEDAKMMLTNKEYNKYTILSIGLESGFNSKSSFYDAFNKFLGKTPLEFKKGVRNN